MRNVRTNLQCKLAQSLTFARSTNAQAIQSVQGVAFQCCHPGHNDRRYTKVSQSWLDAICGSMKCARPIHGQCRKYRCAKRLQSLRNAIIQDPMAFGTQWKKSSTQGSMKQFASILRGDADLGAAFDNEPNTRRIAISNFRGSRLNVTSNRLLNIVVVQGGQCRHALHMCQCSREHQMPVESPMGRARVAIGQICVGQLSGIDAKVE